MSLAFLSARAAVPARSPVADAAAAAGGVLDERDGWVVPVSFSASLDEQGACTQSVGWADASHLGKREVRAGASVPAGTAVRDDRGWLCAIARERSLRLVFPGLAAEEEDGLDVTTQLAALWVVGPAARETIARFCALDLRPKSAPPGAFRPGSLARTPGYVLTEARDAFLLLFGAAYAEYLWTVVSDAGSRLAGRPVGTDTVAAFTTSREGASAHA